MKPGLQSHANLRKIMRITFGQVVAMLILTGVTHAATTKAQNALDRTVTLTATHQPLQQVIPQIESQAGVKFIYSKEFIPLNEVLSFTADREKLGVLLEKILGPLQIRFEALEDRIVLRKSKEAATTAANTPAAPAPPAAVPTLVPDLTVSGRVYAETGESLPGVNVIIKGTNRGTTSDAEGRYVITVSRESDVLQFSFIGYAPQEVTVGNRSIIDIHMEPDVQSLQEIVVVGYGTQEKRDITGTVAVVGADKLVNQSVPNVGSALQGKVSGVQITNNGTPGAAPQIRIRGVGSVTNGVNPLFVVDDVIVNDIAYLGPNDIENISILKDASSAAIYGVRAANGVVLITTKKGKKDERMTVTLDSYMGYKNPSQVLKMANGAQYIDLYNEKMQYLGLPAKQVNFSDYNNTSTNWYDQVLQGSFTQSHDLNLRGGSANTAFNMGVNYLKDDGLVKTNPYDRLSLKLNYDYDVSKYVKTGMKMILTGNKSKGYNGDLLNLTYRALPVFAPFDDNGNYVNPNQYNLTGQATNPRATLDYFHSWQNNLNGVGNLYLEVKPMEALKLKTSVGVNANNSDYIQFDPQYYVSDFQQSATNNLTKSRSRSTNLFWDNTATFEKTINDDHHLTVLAGYSYQLQTTNFLSAGVTGLKALPAIEQSYLFLTMPRIDDVYSQNISDNGSKTVSISYLGRINYSYKDKYLVTATLRADGSSRFPKQNRWGYFPSIGLGWNISEESFLADVSWVEYLKLRGSYGMLGNNNIPGNLYTPVINTTDYYGVVFGPDQNNGNGTVSYPGTVDAVFNPNLKWEVVKEWDLGIDGEFFDGRLTATLDYYYKKTTDAIFPVTDIGSSGLTSGGVWGNYADILNTGVELTLGWTERKGDWSYGITVNGTYNHNELTAIKNGGKQGIYGQYSDTQTLSYSTVGQPIGSFYGYQTAGVFQNAEELAAKPHLPGAQPGDLIFQDTNKDGVIDASDRTFIGNPNVPFFYGASITLGYKHFDFLLNLQGVSGNDIFNVNRMYRFGNENWDADFYAHRWHGEGTSNSYPSAVMANPTTPSSFYVEKGDYLRFKTIQLGYTLPGNIAGKAGLSKARIYGNLENLVTFFGYNGFSPEVASSDPQLAATDRNVYPLSKVYTLGINLTF